MVLRLALAAVLCGAASAGTVAVWSSSEDGALKLTPGAAMTFKGAPEGVSADIEIDPQKTYRSLLGMGASLDHATCYNLSRLPDKRRAEVIDRLVNPETGIGMNLMRLCIGTSGNAIALQNEPGFAHRGYPTCLWRGKDQRDFIRDHLAPALAQTEFSPKIWCWDHNWDYLEFPRAVLDDPEAAKHVDGTAFRFYEGEVEAQTVLHDEFPERHIQFTEGSTFRTTGAVRIIGILRNWARSCNAWVILLDEDRKPNNGPHGASATCIEPKDDLSVEYRYDYWMYGQFMKFLPRGAVRVMSTSGDRQFANVTFMTPAGELVLVAANAGKTRRNFAVSCSGERFAAALGGRSVGTYRWQPASRRPRTREQ